MSTALRCLFVMVGLPLVVQGQAPARDVAADKQAARTAVETYLHGLKFNDVESLKRVFLPDVKLQWIKRDGTLGQLTQEDWYKTFAASAGKEEEGTLRVESLEVTDDIASAKVLETYPKSVYVDYISLIRIQGRWWIAGKVYTSHPR